ncbi:MAG: flagellar hook-associated protein FlgL [Desulfuromonadales bacterium]|nr:flagellar hook-associated protein FlgL [Desulfuromonadales bacterium]
MRITTKMTADNSLYNINEGRIKLDKLNEKTSSGLNVNRPSDDPVATRRILDVENQIKNSTQFISNIKTGQTWLDMAGTSLEGLLSTVMDIKSTAGQAVSGISDPTKKADMLGQLKLFREQLLDYTDTQVGNQYVFSGFNSNNAPFSPTTLSGIVTTAGSPNITNINTTDLYVGMPITGPDIPANSVITAIPTPGAAGAITLSNAAANSNAAGTLTFSGKFKGTEDPINIDVGSSSPIPINVSGGAVLRGGTPPGSTGVDIIKTVDELMLAITNNDVAGIQAANKNLDTANQQVLRAVSDVGMRKARLDNSLSLQQRNSNTLRAIHDDMQNVDMAAAAIALTQQKTAFDAALSATAKITPLSLLDYI